MKNGQTPHIGNRRRRRKKKKKKKKKKREDEEVRELLSIGSSISPLNGDGKMI